MRFGFLAFAALALTTPAKAAVYIITYAGIVANGIDNRQLFGGGDLSGAEYLAVYTFNYPGNYTESFSGTPDAGSRSIIGVKDSEIPTDIPVTGTITINGYTYWYGDFYGLVGQVNNDRGKGCDQITHATSSSTPPADGGFGSGMHNSIYSCTQDFISSRDVFAPLSYTVHAGDVAYGSFASYSGPAATHPFTSLNLRPTSVNVIQQSAVPEGATWTLMLVGFGVIGFGMRRRSREPLAAV